MTAPVLFLALLLGGADHAAPIYQDGVLRAFHSVTIGSRCPGSDDVTATTVGDNTRGSTDTSVRCRDVQRAIYTVQVGDSTYDLAPQPGFFSVKSSSLANHLPGTALKIRANGSAFFVKVGDRESKYVLYAAQ
jgi:hypothetical protein